MDTRDFIRVSVSGLGLRKTAKAPCSSNQQQQQQQQHQQQQQRQLAGCCEIKLPGFPVQKAPAPVVKLSDGEPPRSLAASFYLDHHALDKLLSLPVSCLLVGASPACLELVLYMPYVTGEDDMAVVGVLRLPVTSDWWDIRPGCSEVLHEGWVKVKQQQQAGGWEMHAVVRAELDPRYVLQFDGDVALSPRVIQVAGDGSYREQPVFSCKFTRERLLRSSRAGLSAGDVTPGRVWDNGSNSSGNMDRKGWLVTIHDLSGSPVAAASMVTPFVPSSPGSDYVGSSNPGAWLILVPEQDRWRTWGRLEAWRQRTGIIGLRLQLFGGGSGDAPQLVSEATMSMRKKGEFSIDTGELRRWSPPVSPVPTPQSSGDCSVYLGPAEGFVMRCVMPKRGGGGGSGRSRRGGVGRSTAVQLSTRYISCVEDAAVYVALAAAVDLCRDACQPFTRRLRKELAGLPY